MCNVLFNLCIFELQWIAWVVVVVALTNVFHIKVLKHQNLDLVFLSQKDYLKATYFDLKALSDVSSLDIIHFSAI